MSMTKPIKTLSFLERAGKPGGGKGILVSEEMTLCLATMLQPKICAVFDITGESSNSMKSPTPDSCFKQRDICRTLDGFCGSPLCNQGGGGSG